MEPTVTAPTPPFEARPPIFSEVPPPMIALYGVEPAEADALWDTACQIATRMATDEPSDKVRVVAFDPATILAIIALIVEVVKMVRGCYPTPAAALAVMKGGGVKAIPMRMVLNRAVRRHIDDPEAQALLGSRPVRAILAYSQTLSVDQADAIFASVR